MELMCLKDTVKRVSFNLQWMRFIFLKSEEHIERSTEKIYFYIICSGNGQYILSVADIGSFASVFKTPSKQILGEGINKLF